MAGKRGRPRKKLIRARDKKGKFIGDNPETPENEAWKKQKESKLQDLLVTLKGNSKRKSFWDWLTGK
jgi:hypothetical protein